MEHNHRMSFSRNLNRHSLVLTAARGILAAALAGSSSTVQDLSSCPDCSRIPLATITPCSELMVCGHDHNTYASACLALCQGIEIEHAGSCNGIEDECPGATADTDKSQKVTNQSTEEILHFTERELRKFEGFILLGKAEQKTQAKSASESRPPEGSTQTSRRKCSIVRFDSKGNLYIGRCAPTTEHSSHVSNLRHGNAPALAPAKSSSTPVTKEPRLPEQQSVQQHDHSEHRTASHRSSSDMPLHETRSKKTSPRQTLHGLISYAKVMFNWWQGPHQEDQAHSRPSSAPKQGLRGLQAIIGEDNRALVSSTEYPYTAIGQLRYAEAGTGAGFLCTGTLFSDRHVLTNAHCIYDRASGQFHSDWEFVPGLDSGREPFGRVSYEFFDIYTDGYTTNFKNWDLAIVTLSEPVGLQTGWMGVKSLPPVGACTSSPLVLKKLHTVGYPVEPTASSTAYQDVCDLNVRNGCLHEASSHTCDTKVGNSGSPLFQADSLDRSKWLIRAVHFAGLKDSAYNLAIPIDDIVFQWVDCYRAGNTACLANDLMPSIA